MTICHFAQTAVAVKVYLVVLVDLRRFGGDFLGRLRLMLGAGDGSEMRV